jgi:hypothetical protein
MFGLRLDAVLRWDGARDVVHTRWYGNPGRVGELHPQGRRVFGATRRVSATCMSATCSLGVPRHTRSPEVDIYILDSTLPHIVVRVTTSVGMRTEIVVTIVAGVTFFFVVTLTNRSITVSHAFFSTHLVTQKRHRSILRTREYAVLQVLLKPKF